MRPETLSAHTVSVSNDCVAVRDQADERNVHLFDAQSGKPLNDGGRPFQHRQEVAEVALDQAGLPNARKMAIVDKNRDLFLVAVRRFGQGGGGGGSSPQQARQMTCCTVYARVKFSLSPIFRWASWAQWFNPCAGTPAATSWRRCRTPAC